MKRITIIALIVACTGCAQLNEPLSVHGQFWHKHGMTPEQMVGERGPGWPDTWAIAREGRDLTDAEVVALDRSVSTHGFVADTQQFSAVERRLQAGYHKRSE